MEGVVIGTEYVEEEGRGGGAGTVEAWAGILKDAEEMGTDMGAKGSTMRANAGEKGILACVGGVGGGTLTAL